MATGAFPFRGDSTPALIVSIVHDPPVPPLRVRPDLPDDLSRIIAKCLEKSPDLRYQHAADIVADLKRFKRDSGSQKLARETLTGARLAPPAAPPPAARRRLAVWAGAGALVLAALAIGIFYRTGHPLSAPTPGASVEAPLTVRPLATLPGRKQRPIFSADGNAIAFAWDGGEDGRNSDVYLMQVDAGRPLRLTSHPASEWPQTFSPDGRRLYFTRQSESDFASFWIPTLGGDETRVTDGIVTDISPDGRLAAVVRPGPSPTGSGVFVLDLNTGAGRRLATDFGAMNPKFGPDGQWLYVQDGPDRDHLSLHRVPVQGGKLEPVTFAGLPADVDRVETVEMPLRRSRMLISARTRSSNALVSFIANSDGSELRRLPSSVPPGALSPDGRQMVSVRSSFGVKLYRVEAFPRPGERPVPEKVLDTPNEEYSPRISPDRSRVLLSSYRPGRWEIWLWNIEFTDGRPLFSREGGTAGSPAWSPDGKWIAFDARTRNAAGDIWLMPVGGEPKILVDHPDDDVTPCFDPSGRSIAFTSNRTGSFQLFRVPVSGEPAVQVTQSGAFTCQFSEDGRYIYYLRTRNGGEIWRIDLAQHREEPVVPEMKSRNWKVLSDGIYLLDSQNNSQLGTASRVADARFYRFATRRIQDLGFRTPKAATFLGIDISPDRKWLYYSQIDSSTSELFLTENLPF